MGHRNFIGLSIIVVGVSFFVSGSAAVNKQMVRGVLYTKKTSEDMEQKNFRPYALY